jgi:5'-nucleotidase
MNKNNSKLIIGISSRALFDLDESHEIYKTQGLDSYREYQIDNEDKILNPGKAFPLVKKILNLNNYYDEDRIEVILLSRNTSDTGLRIRNSIEGHNLDIKRAAFCGGESPHRYVKDLEYIYFFQAALKMLN